MLGNRLHIKKRRLLSGLNIVLYKVDLNLISKFFLHLLDILICRKELLYENLLEDIPAFNLFALLSEIPRDEWVLIYVSNRYKSTFRQRTLNITSKFNK